MCFWLVFGGSISWLRYGDPHPEGPHMRGFPALRGVPSLRVLTPQAVLVS